MKTKFYWIAAIMILSIVLGACGPQATEAPPPEPTKAEPTEAPAAVEEVEEDEAEVPEEEEVEAASPEEVAAALNDSFDTWLANMEGYQVTSLEDLNVALVENPPFLLDVRSASEAEENGHIEGAVLIPLRDLGKNIDKLPAFDASIVAYCGSGWRATSAAMALGGLGYEDVKILKGGSFGGWVEAGYPIAEGVPPEGAALNEAEPDAEQLAIVDEALSSIPEGWGVITAENLNTALVENPDLVLVDVRRFDEVDEKGVILAENFIHIPVEDFAAEMALWPADKDAEIVTYCGSGHRSTLAMMVLWANGYSNVTSLKGGFSGWVGEGYPVEGGAAAGVAALNESFDTWLANMEGYQVMSLEDLNVALVEDPPFLLDVRSASEAEENGHIEGAVLIPLRDLGKNIDKLPAFDASIVAYCGSGWRATSAAMALGGLGYEDVKILKGGSFGGWVEAGYPIAEGVPPEGAALNEAEPDAEQLAIVDEALSSIPEGWGVITAENLNTALVENPDLVLVDVRRFDEVDEKGVILAENFIHIPVEDFAAEMALWPADKDAEIVTYCGSGHRSTLAMMVLWANGYSNVTSLKGGFGGWTGEEYPVVEFAAP